MKMKKKNRYARIAATLTCKSDIDGWISRGAGVRNSTLEFEEKHGTRDEGRVRFQDIICLSEK